MHVRLTHTQTVSQRKTFYRNLNGIVQYIKENEKLPNEGFKSITVPEDVYVKLMKLAEKNSRSVAKQIEHFLKTCKEA